ncbi:methionyl-tRNA formyltransferase [Synechococcus sp. A15-60]|uniref:methionyl-tRNA formyltransferase n=1 Tax=Synechococcus sp. A15-60 TaxID=1050655 RepID=UPI00164478FA|nr:methionyl-tRNA formyltransferase [Synechococcus sp. A15-60]QNI48468.1 methionyl-tRNA formyltransferase [Synechococcus sp. A15-60]
MKILFWGTPTYAVPTLDALCSAGHEIVGVVTQPDRRRGRGQQLIPSPVKLKAIELGVPVFTPERIRKDLPCQRDLAELGADLSVVVAFGQILPKSVLEQPPRGCWNGHGSLLPRWRGAGPIQWALLEGDERTGVGVMAMEEGLDTGPVLLERAVEIGLLDNAQVVANRLSDLTASLIVEAMPLIESAGLGCESERFAKLNVRPQTDDHASYARMLKKEDFAVDWSDSALSIHRKVMGLYPGAVTQWQGKRLKLMATEPLIARLKSQLTDDAQALISRWTTGQHKPGEVLDVSAAGVVVSSSGCPLLIREAQLEGKNRSVGLALGQQLNARPGDQMG